jgi:methylmalonyl-CoA/ethylmalonyl-CoA epimerase
VALEVDDIEGALETLKQKGIPLVDEKPRTGVENTKIAFLHPKGTKALLEIVEPRQ